MQILKDEGLNLDPKDGSDFVLVSPQRIKLKLRPGLDFEFRLEVAQAKQYPLDLYYLMDLSNSMSDDKDTIVRLGAELIKAVRDVTQDFQIGFGSFVDKEVMPFISLVPQDNCQSDGGCPSPYSFQHQMDLSPDASTFQAKVAAANISGNIDNPEGGFDALMQVMVCEEMVGWRNVSRRVIIFTTDQSFHIAMDGKLGGLVSPNDGQCHLNETGFYTYSTLQDYPSIGHINHIAKEKSVSIIWAVTASKFDLYHGLSDMVAGSTAGILSADSSNIVELVRQQYEKITTSIEMKSTHTDNCKVEFNAVCSGPNAGLKNGCSQVELGQVTPIDVKVNLKSCQRETFVIYPVGIQEQLIVEIEPLCECECSIEAESSTSCDSVECNGHGRLVCGECQCCQDFFGHDCRCENGQEADQYDPDARCRPTITNGTVSRLGAVCSGQGVCDCGQCICHAHTPGVNITGEFCNTVIVFANDTNFFGRI